MLSAKGFQSATTCAVTPSAGMRSAGICSTAIHSSASCELSSRFDNIGAGIPSSGSPVSSRQISSRQISTTQTAATVQVDSAIPEPEGTFVKSTGAKSTGKSLPKTVITSIDESVAVSRKAPQEALRSKTRENSAQGSAASVAPKEVLRSGHWKFFGESVNQELKVDNVVEKLDSGKLWVVNSRRRNGLIVLREFHAEFAGPGAAVGGDLDSNDIVGIIPIGNLSLLSPDSHEAHQNAIKIRLQWIRLTQNFTDQPQPDDRARMILEQFKTYFDQATVDLVPDQAFAMLVGVLPRTIQRVRAGFVW